MRWLALVIALGGVFSLTATSVATPAATNVDQVLRLDSEVVRKGLTPVRISGVVTWVVAGAQGTLLVHDRTGGMLVAHTNGGVGLRPGDCVEVAGYPSPGPLQASIKDANIRVVGVEPLPDPVRVPAARLAAEMHFGEWVAIEGKIHDAGLARGDLVLQVTSKTQPFYVYVSGGASCFGNEELEKLVDSRVELRGVVWTLAGADQRPHGFRLHVPGTNHMNVVPRSGADLFDQPLTSARTLRRLRESRDDHVRVRGTVLHVYDFKGPYRLVLQDETGPVAAYLHVPIGTDRNVAAFWRNDPRAVWRASPPPPAVKAGDVVDLVGSPSAMGEAAPLLHGGEFRLVSRGQPIAPRVMTAPAALSPAYDHHLVRVKARVVDRQSGEWGEQALETFWLQADGLTFEARLLGGAPRLHLPDDSLVELTGLALPILGETGKPRGLQMELRTPGDIRLLREPVPLMNPAVAKWLGISGACVLGALLWGWSLRRQVGRRTAELATSIREQKRAEAELIDALKRERELGKLKSSFVSVVSHEFRTPLGVIVSSADILRRYLDRLSPEKRQHQIDVIQRATRSLSDLVEEVLLLGKVEAGKLKFMPVALDLPVLCRNLVDEVMSATSRQCPIRLTIDESIKALMGDETLLRPMISNLLSNAVKYSAPGSVVEFAVEREPTCVSVVCFRVRDEGIGIRPEDRKRLFEPFVRGSNIGDRPGTGLGLVIVKHCVELHNGDIDIQSAPEVGTTVTVRLPMPHLDGAAPPAASWSGRNVRTPLASAACGRAIEELSGEHQSLKL